MDKHIRPLLAALLAVAGVALAWHLLHRPAEQPAGSGVAPVRVATTQASPAASSTPARDVPDAGTIAGVAERFVQAYHLEDTGLPCPGRPADAFDGLVGGELKQFTDRMVANGIAECKKWTNTYTTDKATHVVARAHVDSSQVTRLGGDDQYLVGVRWHLLTTSDTNPQGVVGPTQFDTITVTGSNGRFVATSNAPVQAP